MSDRKPRGSPKRNGKVNGLQSPGELDFKKADKVLKKLVRENKEWLKEMAEK